MACDSHKNVPRFSHGNWLFRNPQSPSEMCVTANDMVTQMQNCMFLALILK